MQQEPITEDTLFAYSIFLMPIIQVIIELFSYFSGVNLGLTPYYYLLFAFTYYLIYKKSLYRHPAFIFFNFISIIHLVFSIDKSIAIIELVLFLMFLNTTLILFSGKTKIIRLKPQFIKLMSIIILIGFYIFIFGIDLLGSENYDGKYHAGIFGLPHAAAYLMLAIVCYNLAIEKNFNWLSFFSFLGIILTGVRTTIIAAILFIFLFILTQYKTMKTQNIKAYFLVSLILIGSFITLFFVNIPFLDPVKNRLINEETQSQGIDQYSNGRLGFIENVISDISTNRDVTEILIGKSPDYVYLLNEEKTGERLWTHNDFTMVLSSFGIIGFLFFIHLFFSRPYNFLKKEKVNNSTIIIGFILLITAFFLANLNGFYHYRASPIYLYIFALLAIQNSKFEKHSQNITSRAFD